MSTIGEKQMIPMCWKCSQSQTEPDDVFIGAMVLTGCDACDIIKSYEDAKKHCPLIQTEFEVDVQS